MKLLPLFLFGLAALAGCSTASSDDAASSDSALATTPMALSGTYSFHDVVTPSNRLTVDVVDTRMSDSAERLATLRDSGAACTLVISNTYRCTKNHGASAVPASTLAAIADRNEELAVSFGPVTGSPSLVSEAESLTEWTIEQIVSGPGGTFDHYTYLQLGGGLVKIVLPDGSETGDEYIVQDAGHLAKWNRKATTESRWRYHEDSALVVLSN